VELELSAVKKKIQQKLDLQAMVLKKEEHHDALTSRRAFINEEIARNRAALEKGV